MKKNDIKILLIGIGRWGRNHLKTLLQLVDDLYVVDSDPNQLKICQEFPIPNNHISTDYHEFLSRVDGVDIVTPADTHLKICRDCLNQRKNVFVEKPISLNTSEAKEMILLAKENGVILQVGHIYRYHPASSKMKEILEQRVLGNIYYAYGHFMGFKRPRTDVGVTQTDAIHYIDLFNFLFDGPPQTVTSVIKNHLNLPLDDTSISILEYGEKMVYIEAGYMSPERKRDVAIIGELGSLYCDFQKNYLLLYENRHEKKANQCIAIEGKVQEIQIQNEEPLKIELRAFIDSIKHRSKPLADGLAGFEALKVVEVCYESSRNGKRMEIEWEKFKNF